MVVVVGDGYSNMRLGLTDRLEGRAIRWLSRGLKHRSSERAESARHTVGDHRPAREPAAALSSSSNPAAAVDRASPDCVSDPPVNLPSRHLVGRQKHDPRSKPYPGFTLDQMAWRLKHRLLFVGVITVADRTVFTQNLSYEPFFTDSGYKTGSGHLDVRRVRLMGRVGQQNVVRTQHPALRQQLNRLTRVMCES